MQVIKRSREGGRGMREGERSGGGDVERYKGEQKQKEVGGKRGKVIYRPYVYVALHSFIFKLQ